LPSVRVTVAAPIGLAQLTDRDRHVLIEVAKGLSNTEIAQCLFVGEPRVERHIRHIFTTLDLRDGAQAIVPTTRTGWCALA
jgi:DNA-binding NarL/FixJ family response regulator